MCVEHNCMNKTDILLHFVVDPEQNIGSIVTNKGFLDWEKNSLRCNQLIYSFNSYQY